MKISNNALNFLLAQYRAIFKRAYIKGIASAVILTAGLAAGAAQADSVQVDDYYIYSTDDSKWSHRTDQIDTVTDKNHIVAGALAGDALADKLAEANPDITGSNTASGGKLTISDGNEHQFNKLSGKAWGGNAQTTTGNACAEHNKVLVTGSATLNYQKSTTSGGDVIGGRAISAAGIAYASDNKVEVQKVADKTISIAGVLKAGYAEGFTGAVAENGEQVVHGVSATDTQAISKDVIAGHAFAKTNGTGNYRAEGNTLDLQYVNVSGSTELSLVGGQADGKSDAKGDNFSALSNSIM